MSEQEKIEGTLKPTGKTVKEYMVDVEFPSYYSKTNDEDIKECFVDKFYRYAVEIDGMVYEVESKDVGDSDIFNARKGENGEIHFVVSYYNGGCSFDDAIETAIQRMNGE